MILPPIHLAKIHASCLAISQSYQKVPTWLQVLNWTNNRNHHEFFYKPRCHLHFPSPSLRLKAKFLTKCVEMGPSVYRPCGKMLQSFSDVMLRSEKDVGWFFRSSNISRETTATNQCKRDLWRPGSVKIKRYYAKNGRLIPTAKRGKEIKQQWNYIKTNTIYLPDISVWKTNLLRGLNENEYKKYKMTVTYKSFEIQNKKLW